MIDETPKPPKPPEGPQVVQASIAPKPPSPVQSGRWGSGKPQFNNTPRSNKPVSIKPRGRG